jgi:hypothetical protein
MADVRTEEGEVVEELRAVRFTLVDREGHVRAVLGAGSDGATALALHGADERPRAELTIERDGGANLKLHDADGDVRAWLAVGREGDPSLYLQSVSRRREGVRGHARLSVDEHGCPVLSLHDRAGQPRMLLCLDEETGTPSLSYADARGESRLMLRGDDPGGAVRGAGGDPAGVPVLPLGGPAAAADRTAERDPRIAAVLARVARLERRRGRRLLRTAAMLVLAALAGGVAGRLAVPAPVPVPERASAPRLGPALHAQELTLSDPEGNVRARLSVLGDGTPLLWMTDPRATSTVELAVVPDTGAVLRLTGGDSSITLVAPPNQPPSVGAYQGDVVLFQAPSHVARFLPPDLWP